AGGERHHGEEEQKDAEHRPHPRPVVRKAGGDGGQRGGADDPVAAPRAGGVPHSRRAVSAGEVRPHNGSFRRRWAASNPRITRSDVPLNQKQPRTSASSPSPTSRLSPT